MSKMSKISKMSKTSMSPEELSKQLESLAPPSQIISNDESSTGFPLTPPVFSDLSRAPSTSTSSKNSLGSISTASSSSKKVLTPINLM